MKWSGESCNVLKLMGNVVLVSHLVVKTSKPGRT